MDKERPLLRPRAAIAGARHTCMRVDAKGNGEVVTEIFDTNGQYINEDATFGVWKSLTVPFDRQPTAEEQDRYSAVEPPFTMIDFDFVLQSL